eukprot:scaffold20384_cov72-Cyclotella_meneghiniana.AAC.4
MLVSSFLTTLQGAYAVSALKYLMLLSGKSKVMNMQIQRLVLETCLFEILAGQEESSAAAEQKADAAANDLLE